MHTTGKSNDATDYRYAVGIDLGGTRIKAALVERDKGSVYEIAQETEAEHGPDHVLDRIGELVRKIDAETPDLPLSGIGIGAPGAINWERTSVIYPPNLPGWEVVDIRQELSARLNDGRPVFVENDANLAGLGSAHYGMGRPFPSFIMITLGTGVGGAIIYNNKIFRGTTGAAGEIGHVTIDFEGNVDRYGIAGAIEAYLGQKFLSHYGRYKLLTRHESRVHELAGDDLKDLTPLVLYQAALDGDEPAREVLNWAGHKLGVVLGSAINLLDIRKVVVGGGLSAAGDFIFEAARRSVREYAIPDHRDDIEIVRETLGNEAGMLGAAHLVFQSLDEMDPATL
ncbi:MAG: ROK family protein [Rhodothermales bacterium]